jgi:hypothetical protein
MRSADPAGPYTAPIPTGASWRIVEPNLASKGQNGVNPVYGEGRAV